MAQNEPTQLSHKRSLHGPKRSLRGSKMSLQLWTPIEISSLLNEITTKLSSTMNPHANWPLKAVKKEIIFGPSNR
jgi:hypothetical protein